MDYRSGSCAIGPIVRGLLLYETHAAKEARNWLRLSGKAPRLLYGALGITVWSKW
ncbi:hypothetical protein [Caldicoprobacter faecalis]|uniref:hypothetical protein n=1 Tax=Caldicoprobacter faecalis TaxID=937334 RepID=UPI0015A7062D|nr:hypothetical protein [Caldicoprobacter faecalis]